MAGSWNIFGVILLLSFFRFQVLQAQTLRFTSLPTGPTSVEVGKNLTVYVTYEYTGRTGTRVHWFKGPEILVRKLENGSVITFQNRSLIKGQASLVLASTTLMDNGTYKIRATANDVGQSLDADVIVIIEERPNATTNCSKSHVINEGADLLCLCSAKDGSPPPTAAWFKDRTLIGDRGYGPVTLSLRNINREQAGVYNCTAKSYSLEAFQLVNLTVNYKPEITSFEIVGKTTVVLGEDITLRCKADSVPPSNYYIGLNGSNPEPVAGGLKEIRGVTLNDAGTYICVAENSLGRVNKTLIVSEKGEPTSPSTVTTVPTESSSPTTETLSCNSDRRGTQWYLILIAVTVGMFLGMIVMYLIKRLWKRLNKRRNLSKPSNPGATQGNYSEYQELDLRERSNRDNYQSLMLGSQVPGNRERQNERDPDYQGLSIVRENEENYESFQS